MNNVIAQLVARIAELERRQANLLRRVRVVENTGDGRVRVTDGAGFDPAPVPQSALSAGNWRIDAPADAGSQGWLLSPDGDPSLAEFIPTMASDAAPSASTEPSRMRLLGPGGEEFIFENGTMLFRNSRMDLGDGGGPAVARIGDLVHVQTGSSAGHWPIVTGSSIVNAA